MLKLHQVSKTFNPGTINEKKALKSIDLHLKPGDFVTVIGGNGAGKSTMLNAVAGVWPVDEGSVVIDGTDVTGMPEHVRAQYSGRVRASSRQAGGEEHLLFNMDMDPRRPAGVPPHQLGRLPGQVRRTAFQPFPVRRHRQFRRVRNRDAVRQFQALHDHGHFVVAVGPHSQHIEAEIDFRRSRFNDLHGLLSVPSVNNYVY